MRRLCDRKSWATAKCKEKKDLCKKKEKKYVSKRKRGRANSTRYDRGKERPFCLIKRGVFTGKGFSVNDKRRVLPFLRRSTRDKGGKERGGIQCLIWRKK